MHDNQLLSCGITLFTVSIPRLSTMTKFTTPHRTPVKQYRTRSSSYKFSSNQSDVHHTRSSTQNDSADEINFVTPSKTNSVRPYSIVPTSTVGSSTSSPQPTATPSSSQYSSSGQYHNILHTTDEVLLNLPLIHSLRPVPLQSDPTILFTLPVPNDFNLANSVCSFGFFRLCPSCWIPSPRYYNHRTHTHSIVSSVHGCTGTSAKTDFASFDCNAELQIDSNQYWTRDIDGTFVRSYNYGEQMKYVAWLTLTQIQVENDDSESCRITTDRQHPTSSTHNNHTDIDHSLRACLLSARSSNRYIVIKQLHPPLQLPYSLDELHYCDALPLMDIDLATIIHQFIRMLRLYDNFTQYNELIDSLQVRQQKINNLGCIHYLTRLYRGPTVWEDMCKAQLVTNITWNRTVRCCELLCKYVSCDGLSWPTPYDIIRVGKVYLEQQCNVGYRSERLIRLAQLFVDEQLESKLTDLSNNITISTHELYQYILSIYGFGAFSSHNVVQLLGRYDVIPSDSETVRHLKLVSNINKSTKITMKQCNELYSKRYNKYAPYQYLGMCVYIE